MPQPPQAPADFFYEAGEFKPPSPEELDRQIPSYEFLEFIDRGGMGAVYRARQRSLNRVVAVKLLPAAFSNRNVFAERFLREARALALLNHPNIVSVYDSGVASNGCLYYAMEFVKGVNLRRYMKESRGTAKQLLDLAIQVCEALQFAHSRGVVHRDVKPANILIDEAGRVKVADFGLAKIIGTKPQQNLLTGSGDALGTPDYMAPEAVTHEYEVDHRADIYSLGVMLYEMLTNHVPRGAWEPPSSAAGVDTGFDVLVSRALQTDPKRRFQNVGDLTAMVRQLVEPDGTGSVDPALDRKPPEASPGGSMSASPSASTMAVPRPATRARPSPPYWVWGVSTVVLLSVGLVMLKNNRLLEMLASHGAQPAASTGAMPEPHSAEAQRALARWVIDRGGVVNVITHEQPERLMGGPHDLDSADKLPEGRFTLWRISMLRVPNFGDEDLAALAIHAALAGDVENINLAGTSITAKGLVVLPKMASSLVNLNIKDTQAFTEEGFAPLSTLKNLRLLRISNVTEDPTNTDVGPMVRLIDRLKGSIPDLTISEY